jgi:hypothetical protein
MEKKRVVQVMSLFLGGALLLDGALFLGGCTQHDEFDSSLRIRLGAGTQAVQSRAAVNDLAGLSAAGSNVGIYGMVTASSSGTALPGETWGNTPLMDNVRTTSIDATTGAIGWSDTYTYPVEESSYVRFCAYHPYAAAGLSGSNYVVAPAADRAPELYFTLTGSEDVMYATPVTGGKSTTPGTLVFNHALTQIRFRVVDETGNFSGETLSAITFNGVNTTSSMNLESGAPGSWGTPSNAISAGVGTSVTITGTTEAPQSVGSPVMLQPGQSSFSLKVITSKGTFGAVTIRPTSSTDGGTTTESSFAAGRSYLITLIFRSLTQLAVTAAVTPWVMDGTGQGIIQ